MLRELRIGTEAFLNPRAALVGIVEALLAEEPGDDSRFADPRLTLDHDQPARAGDEGLQASMEMSALGEPAHARRGLAARPEDRYGLGFALESDRREGLEGEPRPGVLAGRTVAQDDPGGRLHEPGGQVHLVADYRVFATPPPADLSAIDAPGGDADRAAHIQLAESVLDLNRGLHTSRRVVRVGERRQAQGGDQSQALVVEPELVEAPFVAIQGRLERTNDGVSLIQGLRRRDVQARRIDKEHGHRAQLGDPPRLIRVEPRKDRGGDIAAQGRLQGRWEYRGRYRPPVERARDRLEPDVPPVDRRPPADVAHVPPGLGREDHVAGPGAVLGSGEGRPLPPSVNLSARGFRTGPSAGRRPLEPLRARGPSDRRSTGTRPPGIPPAPPTGDDIP